MRDRAGPGRPVVVVEPALVGVNIIAQAEIVQIADDPVAGAGPQQLGHAGIEAALDQRSMKSLEKRAGERVRLAPTLPGGGMQLLHRGKESARLIQCRRLLKLQGTGALEIADGPPQLLPGIGAE